MIEVHKNMTREEIVTFCKQYAEYVRNLSVDKLVQDYGLSIGIGDEIEYPLYIQDWITPDDEPILYAISVYGYRVDNDHTNRESWEQLLQLIDIL